MPDFVRYIIAVVLVVGLIGLFIFTYVINKRTPKPEGCVDIEGECEGCQITSCSNYKKYNSKDENSNEKKG